MSPRLSSRRPLNVSRFIFTVGTIAALTFNFKVATTHLESSSGVKTIEHSNDFRIRQSDTRGIRTAEVINQNNRSLRESLSDLGTSCEGQESAGNSDGEHAMSGIYVKCLKESNSNDGDPTSLESDGFFKNHAENEMKSQQNNFNSSNKTTIEMLLNQPRFESDSILSDRLISQMITTCNSTQNEMDSKYSRLRSSNANTRPAMRFSNTIECQDCETVLLNNLARLDETTEISNCCRMLKSCLMSPNTLNLNAIIDQSNVLVRDRYARELERIGRSKRSIKQYSGAFQNFNILDKSSRPTSGVSKPTKLYLAISDHRAPFNDVTGVKRRNIGSELGSTNKASSENLDLRNMQSKVTVTKEERNTKLNLRIPLSNADKRDAEYLDPAIGRRTRRSPEVDSVALLSRLVNFKDRGNRGFYRLSHSGKENREMQPSYQENKSTRLSRPVRSISYLTESETGTSSGGLNVIDSSQNLNNHINNSSARVYGYLLSQTEPKEVVNKQKSLRDTVEIEVNKPPLNNEHRPTEEDAEPQTDIFDAIDTNTNLKSREALKVSKIQKDHRDFKYYRMYRQPTNHRYHVSKTSDVYNDANGALGYSEKKHLQPKPPKWLRSAMFHRDVPDVGTESNLKNHKRAIPNRQLPAKTWPLSIKDIQPKGIRPKNRYRVPRDVANSASSKHVAGSNKRWYQVEPIYSSRPVDSVSFIQQESGSNHLPVANDFTSLISEVPELSMQSASNNKKRTPSTLNSRRLQKFLGDGNTRRGMEGRKLFLGKREIWGAKNDTPERMIGQERSGWAKRRNLDRRPSRPSHRWAVFFLGKRKHSE